MRQRWVAMPSNRNRSYFRIPQIISKMSQFSTNYPNKWGLHHVDHWDVNENVPIHPNSQPENVLLGIYIYIYTVYGFNFRIFKLVLFKCENTSDLSLGDSNNHHSKFTPLSASNESNNFFKHSTFPSVCWCNP